MQQKVNNRPVAVGGLTFDRDPANDIRDRAFPDRELQASVSVYRPDLGMAQLASEGLVPREISGE